MSIPREPAFEVAEYRRRLQRVQTAMTEKEWDLLLLFSPHNVFYLSGMDSENLFDYQCLLVPQDRDPVLIISHFEEARSEKLLLAGHRSGLRTLRRSNRCHHRRRSRSEAPIRRPRSGAPQPWALGGLLREITEWSRRAPRSPMDSAPSRNPGSSNPKPKSPTCEAPLNSPIWE